MSFPRVNYCLKFCILIWLSKSVNKIKKTPAAISHATFVHNVFFDVKFVITKKDSICAILNGV